MYEVGVFKKYPENYFNIVFNNGQISMNSIPNNMNKEKCILSSLTKSQ